MDDDAIRAQAATFADALVAGNVDAAIQSFSAELRRNLGEVLALFPLPASEATVESVDRAGAGYNVVIRLVGESEETQARRLAFGFGGARGVTSTRWRTSSLRPMSRRARCRGSGLCTTLRRRDWSGS